MFYEICKFECSTITNDVIMTSLPKQWQNSELRETKQIRYHLKGIDESLSKNVPFTEYEPLCQRLWAFCQILAFFMMPAHQIWSCHVIQEAKFEHFLFCSNSTFNIRKSHKISSQKTFHFRSYQSKTSKGVGWVENAPQCL